MKCRLADGSLRDVKQTEISIESPYFTGKTSALIFEKCPYELIVGNQNTHQNIAQSCALETRSMKENKQKPPKKLKAPDITGLELSPEQLIKLQHEDESLKSVWTKADNKTRQQNKTGSTTSFFVKKGILYRLFDPRDSIEGALSVKQVVVPTCLREKVLQLAHNSNFSGHLGVSKTVDRVLTCFYWPGCYSDVSRYCLSCDTCQRTSPKPARAPLMKMPAIGAAFDRLSTDLVGPIIPASARGYRYILTAVCHATRYPLAVALKNIDTETVADALLDMLSATGIPREILTDQGSQFTSHMWQEVARLLSFTPLRTTAFNPRCNGAVERLNSSIKKVLKRLCIEQPKEWDRYVSSCLFCLREIPNESTGFSPFELLYGRRVRSPIMILKEFWTRTPAEQEKTTYQYVIDLQNRIEETCKIARGHSELAKIKQKYFHDKLAKQRGFEVGDKVLLLLPKKKNKLELQFCGPYNVVGKKNEVDYYIEVNGQVRLYHINLLKKYHQRETSTPKQTTPAQEGMLEVACSVTINAPDNNESDILTVPQMDEGETVDHVKINPTLSSDKQREVKTLLNKYRDVFTHVPGTTDVVTHEINLTSDVIFRAKPYPAPHHLRQTLRDQIKEMVDQGIIEPSASSYNNACLLVKKPHGQPGYRFVLDARQLNKVTRVDTEPLPNMSVLSDDLSGADYLSSFDLARGYWQVKIRESDRDLTSFIYDTDSHAMRYVKMPFGLVNSGATFCRLMRKVLVGLPGVKNYLDDIICFSSTWEKHIACLEALFGVLRKAGLTCRPSKACVGFHTLQWLGHTVGRGIKQPIFDRVQALVNSTPPTTKRGMRGFLGSANWYRVYVPHFASISGPLSDATKNGRPNKIQWSPEMLAAYEHLKQCLASEPILKLPDFSKTFFVQTDASIEGLSGVLLQKHGDQKFPVVYVSRKLNEAEKNYAIVELECLAIVYTIKKCSHYLLGRQFILESDASALLYLNKAKHSANRRLTRWALELQEFDYRIHHIPGKENLLSDYLSRSPPV